MSESDALVYYDYRSSEIARATVLTKRSLHSFIHCSIRYKHPGLEGKALTLYSSRFGVKMHNFELS